MNQKDFLSGDNGDGHRHLLWLALELTKGSKLPVGELGSGPGSTPFLKQYCIENSRDFYTYDNNKEWADLHGSAYTSEWMDERLYRPSSVVLVDQGPAEMRNESIKFLADQTDILVVHDVEPINSNSYRLHLIWNLFKYKILVKGPKIWTSALSNKIDLEQHIGTKIGKFKIERHEQ